MTGTFEIAFGLEGVEGQPARTPTVLVGVRYTVDGRDIVPDDSTETPYTKDYLPDCLRKWLHYIVSLDDGEEQTFEFTEYSDIQFHLQPSGSDITLTVTRRHSDESLGSYPVDLEQMAAEIVDATVRYREWLFDQNPDLRANEEVQELQELSDMVSKKITD
jgi:hypothetical protein